MGYSGKNFPERTTYSFQKGTLARIQAATDADGIPLLSWVRMVINRALIDSEKRRGVYNESTD